ncbi:MAG: heme ABC exporter ATP-binding protein CcmA [Alphaproteobacteria bacterium]|nr:heme ABC exporter ATP-binding protein CcmA [Alphaproteobacteria bacterium]
MNKNFLIQAQDLSFERSGRIIFSSLNISLEEGQIIFIKGKNGSGKTSLLRCLAGFTPTTSGKILWYGNEVLPAFYSEEPLVAWLGHLDAIKGSLTVKENLLFFSKIWSVKSNTFNKCIKKLSFEKFMNFPASWLSAGEKRRLSLIRLSFCPAKVWILDEPSTFLDSDNREILIGIMNTHLKNKGAIVCATHDSLKISNALELTL